MSWTTPPLLRGLLDDAAVFPPAATPLPDAVRDHGGHRSSWYAGCVGPLLVPAAAVAELIAVLTDESSRPAVPGAGALDVVLVSRPGSDPAVLAAGPHVLRDEVGIQVVGVELGWEQGWRDLGLEDVGVVLEVPRGPDQAVAVADVRTAVGEGLPVLAKLRTGATPTWEWPDATELGAFLLLVAGLQVPFKLTGGLHHAVRGTYDVAGVAERNHGVLNVLLATAAALEDAGPEEIAAVLELTDGTALAELVRAWTTARTADARRAFTAYGCCTVTDPIDELADLGLLPRPGEGP